MNDLVSNVLLSGSADRTQWLNSRPGEQFLIRVSADDTDGRYSLTEIVSSPGDGTPLHVHQREDEHMFVVEGTARVAYGDKILDANAGDLLTLRRGIPHAWGNRSDRDVRFLMLVTPGGCEEALCIIAKDNNVDVRAVAERFGVTLLGPTPF